MPIKFRCPSCRQAYTIASKKAGTKHFCQKCGTKIKVPEKSASEPRADKVQKPVPPPAAEGRDEVPDEDLFADVTPDKNADEDVEFSESPGPDMLADSPPTQSEADFRTAEVEVGGESNERLSPDQYEPPPLDQMDGVGSSESTAGDASEAPSDEEDDLAAVLAFEQSLEDGGEAAAPAHVPLPDELFTEEEDDDEEGFGSRTDDEEELDLTPMVDVTFLLLIFFMITASFSIQKTLSVPPPDPEQEGASTSTKIEEPEDQEQTTIHIDSRNVISVDDEPIPNPSRLVDILRSKRTTDVLITSHESAIHEMLVKVVDAAQEVGMQKIRIGVTKGPE